MREQDILEPDEARSRDKRGKEPPPRRGLATRLFRFGMRGLSLLWLLFRFLRWLVDALGL